MDIFLIRHTTPDIEKGLIYGRLDVPLSSTFQHEKETLIQQLPKPIDAVFSSPSQRCIKLAEAISPHYTIDKNLYELDFGLWEAQTWDTINRQESDYWMEDVVKRSPPQGETLEKMKTRVMQFWERLNGLQAQKVAVITHAGVIRIILSVINNVPLKSLFDFKVAYGQVFHLAGVENKMAL